VWGEEEGNDNILSCISPTEELKRLNPIGVSSHVYMTGSNTRLINMRRVEEEREERTHTEETIMVNEFRQSKVFFRRMYR
jgi:hypothetical protein